MNHFHNQMSENVALLLSPLAWEGFMSSKISKNPHFKSGRENNLSSEMNILSFMGVSSFLKTSSHENHVFIPYYRVHVVFYVYTMTSSVLEISRQSHSCGFLFYSVIHQ